MENNGGIYSGKSKAELLDILSTAGGEKDNVPDADDFQKAWSSATSKPPEEMMLVIEDNSAQEEKPDEIKIDGISFEIPPVSPQWSLIPFSQIETDNLDGLIQSIFDLNKSYGIAYPPEFDDMSIEDIRAWLKEVVSNPDLKAINKKVQRENDLLKRIGNPKEFRSGIFCRINQNGRILFNYAAIADYLHNRFHTITFHPISGPYKMFIYDEDIGIYRPNSGDLESVINRIFELSDAVGSVVRDTKEILHLISSKNRYTTYPFNTQDGSSIGLIPVKNGVVRMDFNAGRVSLIPHTYEHLWTFTIPVSYNPSASPDAIIEIMQAWIGEWSDEEIEEAKENKTIRPEKWKMLLQIPAQGLLQFILDKVYKTSYIIVGEPNAAKSSYITHLLPHFFGSDAVAGESLHKIVSDKFVTGNLENKILNVFDDLSDTELGAVGQFKALTGITRHTINRKHQGEYIGRIFCTHSFACNQPPQVPDSCLYDTAFWDRWIFIRFPFVFEKNPLFQNQLITDTNLSAFLNLIIGMIVSIRQKNALPFQMPVGEVMQLWMQNANPVAQFLEEMTRESPKMQEFDRERFFDAYSKWFDEQNPPIDPRKKILLLKDFAVALIEYEILSQKTSRKRGGKKFNLTVFKGKYSWIHGQDLMEPQIKGLDYYMNQESG